LELNMKSIRNLLTATLLAAGAVMTAASSVSVANAADDTTTPTAPAPGAQGPHGWHHHGGPWHLLSKVNLTAEQKTQVKAIMTAARPEMESLHQQMHANMLKLQQTAPTDPNYTSITSQVSQTHGSLQSQMLTQHAQIRAQVFKVLTPAQQAQLTTLEAQMQAHRHGPRGAGAPAPAAQ
jgi:Spy/CpxP family protein refolding chaperone